MYILNDLLQIYKKLKFCTKVSDLHYLNTKESVF